MISYPYYPSREHSKNNDAVSYRFVQRGSGFRGSEADFEIRWSINKGCRLAFHCVI
jgi:hypothetical protein